MQQTYALGGVRSGELEGCFKSALRDSVLKMFMKKLEGNCGSIDHCPILSKPLPAPADFVYGKIIIHNRCL